ncbi:hypothetical protein EW146_g1767 [Bondarzewia mesenterica]|uniref:Uncharacterized protein n=1 Tax=Bondarzewia mesenterica TaxID=1095465 RepID=A0A4S4M927_9AGAM|nr:hypothetical protein EW146_g1767 [Bondarzewia mesenterica]
MANNFTVLPAGVLDASHATDSIILCGWVLDKPIDPNRIKKAWATLVSRWPLLVARLRRDSKSERWEYHIPSVPTLSGSFAFLNISESIRAHYAYAKPSEYIRCTVKENPHHLFIPYGPKSVDELITGDRPLVHLHVTTFDDGSLVGLSTPHILCDAHGVASIIKAVCIILSGGPPPPPLDLTDPFEPYGHNQGNVPAPPYWRALNIVQKTVLYARAIWTQLFDRHVENRDVFFPKSEVQRIKSEAMDDIRREHGADTDLYISSSDAILAFCLKCSHPPTWSRAPINIFYTASLRNMLNLPQPFLRNAVCMVITPTVPVSAISSLSLGTLALHIRKTITAQTTEEAVETWLRWRLASAGKLRVFFDPWWGRYDVVTNWREMKLMDVDFDGALASKDDHVRSESERVKCVYMWGNGLQPIALRNWIGIWADDPSGGIWTSAFMPRRTWNDKRGYGRYTFE